MVNPQTPLLRARRIVTPLARQSTTQIKGVAPTRSETRNMHSAQTQVHRGEPTYVALKAPFLLARLHRKIRRSKKLTRLLLSSWTPLQLRPHSELLKSGGACIATLLPSTPISPPPPLRCIGEPLAQFDTPRDVAQFPAVEVIRMGPADVFGLSGFVQTPRGQLVHHELFNPATHKASEEDHRRLRIKPANLTAKVIGTPLGTATLPSAAAFTDAVASNYAHWLTEVLPRIVLYTRHACSKGVPLIVDEGLHPNIYESLSIAVGSERLIYTLAKDRRARVHKLDVITPTGYVPYASREPRLPGHSHGVFAQQALLALRGAFSHLMARPSKDSGKRIYVRRNAGLRKLINDQDISEMLSTAGFDIVAPEQLSFTDQVRLFSQAELVIGATGAALANLIFCAPGTRVHVLMAQHQEMPYWYWQRLADCVGVKLSYGLGEICETSDKGFHADFIVPLRVLEEALLSFEPERTEAMHQLLDTRRVY